MTGQCGKVRVSSKEYMNNDKEYNIPFLCANALTNFLLVTES